MKASVTEKKGNDDFGMEISKHFEYKCNKICSNFQVAKRRLLQVLFLHLNPSGQKTLLFQFYGPQGIRPLISSQAANWLVVY